VERNGRLSWRRQRGRCLSDEEMRLYRPYFSEAVLARTRIIEGGTPFWLRRCMNAVVLGHRIYFRDGAYQPGTLRGIELLAHELTHVEQYSQGMNMLRYLWHSRRGYRSNCYEIEAYARASALRRDCAVAATEEAGNSGVG
jgi:hypothetical protein